MTTKEKKQKRSLDKVIRQSFGYQQRELDKRNKRTYDNLMKWNKDNLSPTGGKKAFLKTQKDSMTPQNKSGWLTKDD